jgi:uncharacterized circularly permuted ATP-grasp superfamily protein
VQLHPPNHAPPAPGVTLYEEAHERGGAVRAHYEQVLTELGRFDLPDACARVDAHLATRGVGFGGGSQGFTVDAVPRILGAGEWEELAAGLEQRVRALNAFVRDAYGEREAVAAGVVPAAVIDGASYFEHPLAGRLPEGTPIVIAGLDVVRDTTGEFLVLEDNTRTPSGLAYAVAAREALDLCLALPGRRRAVSSDPLGRALAAAGPEGGHAVLVTDGPRNSAWYEHEALARRLGLPLVLPADLDPRADGLYVREGGGTRRVDVVYRRTDEDRLVGDDGRPTVIGAALLEPWLRGQVVLANAFGAGVADDKLTHAYVEDLVRFYLGEEPRLRSVHTYDPSRPEVLEEVLDRFEEMVVKPRAESGGNGIVVCPHAEPADVERARAAVVADPGAFVVQDVVWFSRHPTVVGDRLEPRHVDLRAFVVTTGDEAVAVPGGLTRVALDAGALVVNSSQDGGAKDTWVLE